MRRSILPALLAVSLATVTAHAATDTDALSGAWVPHHIQFNYMGFTSTYSCDGLEEKLRLLLRTAGARGDMKITTSGCAGEFGRPSKFAAATLTFSTLQAVPASTPGTAQGKAGPAVAAKWHAVILAPQRPFNLGEGDCELVEQFRDILLPLFATRDLRNHTHCIPNETAGQPFSLAFQALVPAAAGG